MPPSPKVPHTHTLSFKLDMPSKSSQGSGSVRARDARTSKNMAPDKPQKSTTSAPPTTKAAAPAALTVTAPSPEQKTRRQVSREDSAGGFTSVSAVGFMAKRMSYKNPLEPRFRRRCLAH